MLGSYLTRAGRVMFRHPTRSRAVCCLRCAVCGGTCGQFFFNAYLVSGRLVGKAEVLKKNGVGAKFGSKVLLERQNLTSHNPVQSLLIIPLVFPNTRHIRVNIGILILLNNRSVIS